jgi:hypothetical protein
MGWTHVTTEMDDGDKVRVYHNPSSRSKSGAEVPESVCVSFDRMSICGTTETMAAALDDALTRVQSIMDAQEEGS